MAAGSFWVL